MRRSCVAIAVATALVAAGPFSATARQSAPEFGLPVELSGAAPAAEFKFTQVPEGSTSATPPKARREAASDVAEPNSSLLLLAGLGVLVFIARRRRLS